jgi:hypothetical protein
VGSRRSCWTGINRKNSGCNMAVSNAENEFNLAQEEMEAAFKLYIEEQEASAEEIKKCLRAHQPKLMSADAQENIM